MKKIEFYKKLNGRSTIVLVFNTQETKTDRSAVRIFVYTGAWSYEFHITETCPCLLGNLRKDILYNCFKNLLLFVKK